ncbi:hypothetical protein BKA70DRAFT_539492 [Coprinopsis sp. MPI-PUGE-AT-0042]|nr:hypothetical protein BKA70DRAFT_539492 [Coprinopsis sp. MPI-PUGE-AT-0042]
MSDSTLPPQLHLSIPPATTSFKRSFEQYGFDVDQSPVDNAEGTESNSNGDHSGSQRNERNKRARSESVLSEGERASNAVAFLPNIGGSSTGLGSGSPMHASTATITGVLSTNPQSPTSRLHVSSLPPRLPTPEMAAMEVDIEMLPPEGTNGPLDTLPTASLSPSSASEQPLITPSALPIPLPLSLSLPAVDLGLGLEGGAERDSEATRPTSDNLTRTMERFAAFDSEIDALRRVSPPPPASPPQLPPLHLNHHRRTSSSGSSSYSSQASTPAFAQPSWTSHPPMFIDVPPTLFDRPFRGLGVDSDSSAAPSSRNSMDVGLQGYTASTQPPTLPPIATTSATIWEDEALSPASAAATIASSSATATQSVYGEQPTMDLNLPEVAVSGSPLEEDPVRWFLPESNSEGETDMAAQPGPPEAVPDPSTEHAEETTPRHPQVDELLFGDDASGEFAALARSYGLIDNDEAPATTAPSSSNPPMQAITPQNIPQDTNDTMEQMMGQALQGFMARGRDTLQNRDHELPGVQGLPPAPMVNPNDWTPQMAPLRRIEDYEHLTSNIPVVNPHNWTPREAPLRHIGDDTGRDSDTDVYLSYLRQRHSAVASVPSQPSNRAEDSSSNRSFRHPLLQHPHRHQHRPSSLRSSTSLVGESRSERGRMRDELDLGLNLRSEPVAEPSSTSASSTAPTAGSSTNPSSSNPRHNTLDAEANAHQREAIEHLNRASELLRTIDQPWTQSARAYVDVATELITSHMDDDEGGMPSLRNVNDSEPSDSDEGNDEMDVQMSGVGRPPGRYERLTEALQRNARERDGVMEVDAPRRGSRFSRARLEAYRGHLIGLGRDGDSEVSGEDTPISQRGPARRHVHPLLGQPSRPFLPAPALPSPDFDMDFMQSAENDAQSPTTRRGVRHPFSNGTRTGAADPGSAGGSTSTPPPYSGPRMPVSAPLESFDVPESFPAAIRRVYHGHGGHPTEGSLSQAMLGYAASGAPAGPMTSSADATGSGVPTASSANQTSGGVLNPARGATRLTSAHIREGERAGTLSRLGPRFPDQPMPSTTTLSSLSSNTLGVRRPSIQRLSIPSPMDPTPRRDTLSESPLYRFARWRVWHASTPDHDFEDGPR